MCDCVWCRHCLSMCWIIKPGFGLALVCSWWQLHRGLRTCRYKVLYVYDAFSITYCISWFFVSTRVSGEVMPSGWLQQVIVFRRLRPLQKNPGLTRIDHFCPISCCAVPCVRQIRTRMKKLWQLPKALIIIIWLSSFFFVWIVNNLFCIIDNSRYKQWIM